MIFTPSITFANAVLNHPAVRPTAECGVYRINAEAVLLTPGTVAVAFNFGLAVFVKHPNEEYDGHIFILPEGRGALAIRFGKLALAALASSVAGNPRLHTGVPLVLPAARWYCKRLGLKPVGRDLFNEYFTTEIQSWAA